MIRIDGIIQERSGEILTTHVLVNKVDAIQTCVDEGREVRIQFVRSARASGFLSRPD
jgi:hypothetical protein